jgi:hypothetical protein
MIHKNTPHSVSGIGGRYGEVSSLERVAILQIRNLMVGYYRRLLREEGHGEGLRRIQLDILNGAEKRTPTIGRALFR